MREGAYQSLLLCCYFRKGWACEAKHDQDQRKTKESAQCTLQQTLRASRAEKKKQAHALPGFQMLSKILHRQHVLWICGENQLLRKSSVGIRIPRQDSRRAKKEHNLKCSASDGRLGASTESFEASPGHILTIHWISYSDRIGTSTESLAKAFASDTYLQAIRTPARRCHSPILRPQRLEPLQWLIYSATSSFRLPASPLRAFERLGHVRR